MIPRYFVVAESAHELQNPISEQKLLALGAQLRLGPGTTVLDVASGRGGPAVLLARTFGCSIEGIEISPDFHAVAVERARSAGVEELVQIRLADAGEVELASERYDVALCLGASFVYGGFVPTLDTLAAAVRRGGHVVVGEPYWRRLPLPADYADRDYPCTTLEGTVDIVEAGGLAAVRVLASSEDDWDRYETLHWDAVEQWLADNPDDPDAPDIRARYEGDRRTYLRYGREYLGWAIFVGWKRP